MGSTLGARADGDGSHASRAIANPRNDGNHHDMVATGGTSPARLSPKWQAIVLMALAVVAFGVAYFAALHVVSTRSTSKTLEDVAEYKLWEVMLAALTGMAAASTVYLWTWLAGVTGVAVGPDLGRSRRLLARCGLGLVWLAIAALVLALIFAGLIHGSAESAIAAHGTDLNAEQAQQIRPFSYVAALCEAPGLAAFVGLRWVATTGSRWRGPGQERIRLLRRLQSESRRLLTLLGAFLTLLVVVTGMRRNAVQAYYESHDLTLDFPAEAVLLYGLVFAVVLGVFYLIAAGGIDQRGSAIVDDYAPMPDPGDEALGDRLKHRADLATLTGTAGASWQTFQTTVVIAAPLVTGLIGAATG